MISKNERSGAEIFLDILESEGTEYIFGNPGTTELPLIDALLNRPNIHYVWALQEASVVAMADGYAQASGKPGVINLHTAGGFGNGAGNLLNALATGTPLVVTAGQQDTRHAIYDPLLQGDLVSIAKPICKWAAEVGSPEQLPVLVHRAFQSSTATPSGAVFLSLPMNVMEAKCDVQVQNISHVDRRPTAHSLEELAKELSEFPPGKIAIIAGDEISENDAYREVVKLAEILAAPVFGSSWPAHIPYPTSHYLWQGNLPTQADGIAKEMKNFDCILALGGKSFITILYSDTSPLPSGCELFQLSSDGRDLGRSYPSKLSLVGDIEYSVKELNGLLEKLLVTEFKEYEAQRRSAAESFAKRKVNLNKKADELSLHSPIHPMVAARELASGIGKTPIIDEALATAIYLRKFLDNDRSKQYFFNRGGALGWGMPAAVGFSLGIGRKPVVSIVGDGAAMYSPQALWTAAYEKLPVTFIVINNREYNILKNFMRSQTDYTSAQTEKFIGMDITDPPIDFLALAKSMGISSQQLTSANDISLAVKNAISSNIPNLIEIVVGTS
jgi:benzoylformate decarboxylase